MRRSCLVFCELRTRFQAATAYIGLNANAITFVLQCDYQKATMEKAAADYQKDMDVNDHEHSEHDDDFNYMTREEQRREDVEAIEESVESIVLAKLNSKCG